MVPVRSPHAYPLTPLQQGMLVHALRAPGSGIDTEQLVCTLREELDVPSFERAWLAIVDRHAVLRTRLLRSATGNFVQTTEGETRATIDTRDWSLLTVSEQQEQLQRYLDEDRCRGFAPEGETFQRAALFCLGPSLYQFVLSSWHGIFDGRAGLTIILDLFACYEAFRRGEPFNRESPRSYEEFVAWLGRLDVSQSRPFWQELLAGMESPTPLGLAPADVDAAGHGEHKLALTPEASATLHEFAKSHDLSINALMQGAWALVLARYSGLDDVVFGTTRACRRSALGADGSGDGIVGVLINTVPVRVRMRPGMSVRTWLEQVRAQHLAVRPHEHTSLVDIQAASSVPADQQLFESLFLYEHQEFGAFMRRQGPGFEHREFELFERTGYPITVYGYGGRRLVLKINYDRSAVDDEAAARLLDHFRTALIAMARPDACIADIDILSGSERHAQVHQWNDTARDVRPATVHQLFEEQARRTPDATALTFRNERVSYAELDRRADRIARRLRAIGAGPGALVGLCLDRSPDLVVALLGILKSGAGYLPLDPTYPTDRLLFMIDDARPLAVFTERNKAGAALEGHARTLAVDEDGELAAVSDAAMAGGEDLAYVIYTSGSTGKPKGVMLEHRQVVNFFTAMDRVLGTEPGVWLAVTSISFDIAVLEIFWTLSRGFEVVLRPDASSAAASQLPGEGSDVASLITRHNVTHLQCTPSFLRVATFLSGTTEALRSLRHLLVGGEPLPADLVRDLGDVPGRRVLNMYGPTETTVWSTCWPVDGNQPISIGRPIANTQVYILDRARRLVPAGVAGEIFIGGAGVARGYLNRVELTADRFVPNPFVPGERMYRTGDIGRRLPDGTIAFLGRVDTQVKIRGHRIELGSIEAVLRRQPGVRDAVVDARDDGFGGKRLVAYVVVDGTGTSLESLRPAVGRVLPSFMVPALVVPIEELPKTPNGKLDRAALPDPAQAPQGPGARGPRTQIERDLLAEWCSVLGIADAGIDDNFFDLGGNSISAVQLIVAVQERFGVDLPVHALLGSLTIAGLADQVERHRATAGEPEAAPRTPTEQKLKEIWKRLLGTPNVGVADSFFDLGGSPAQLGELLSQIRLTFGVFGEGLPIAQMGSSLTIEALGGAIDEGRPSSTIVCLQSKGTRRPLFAIHAGGGYVFFYRALAAYLAPDRPMYGLQANISADPGTEPYHPWTSVEALAARYVEEIKKVQPEGPYHLTGACFGGVIAFEMARQLRARGEAVNSLVMFSSFVMNNPDGVRLRLRGDEIVFAPPGWRTHLHHLSTLDARGAARYVAHKLRAHCAATLRSAARLPSAMRRRIATRLHELAARTSGPIEQPADPQALYHRATACSLRMVARYKPGTFDGHLVMFRATNDDDPLPMWTARAEGGIEVHQMAGGHLDMLEEPMVSTTAALLREHLEIADRGLSARQAPVPAKADARRAAAGSGIVFAR
jgi:amino acid adenylation domain-containing protein